MKTSNQISLLLFGILLGAFIGGYLVLTQLNTLRNDAYAINNLGVIRGSIQLITKRKLNNTASQADIQKVDDIFIEIDNRYLKKEANSIYLEQFNILHQIEMLQVQWNHLKRLYGLPLEQDKVQGLIIEHSELCWKLADKLVSQVQEISEIKLMKYQDRIILILSVISVVIIAIIMIVYVMIGRRLEHEVLTDPLTGLYNRNHFNKVLHDQIRLYRRYNDHFTLSLLDIDFFKSVNDDFGHPQGDKVLVEVAQLIRKNTRDVDILFRLGGEEFAVISPRCNLDDAMHLAEKYRTLIAAAEFNIDRNITVSIGVSQSFEGCKDEDLYKNADQALYEAKSSGRNKALSFNPHPKV